MKVTVFSTKPYDRHFLEGANAAMGHQLRFLDMRLSMEAAALANDSETICAFVNDDLREPVLRQLSRQGVRLVALRSAGFNNVDLEAARALGIAVARVPATHLTQWPSTRLPLSWRSTVRSIGPTTA